MRNNLRWFTFTSELLQYCYIHITVHTCYMTKLLSTIRQWSSSAVLCVISLFSFDKHAWIRESCKYFWILRDQIEYSHARAYLPSSAIKVNDSPIRNLVYIGGTHEATYVPPPLPLLLLLLCSATTITRLVISIVTRECPSSSSHSSTRIHFASRVCTCILCVSKEDASPATQWPAYYDNLIEEIVHWLYEASLKCQNFFLFYSTHWYSNR